MATHPELDGEDERVVAPGDDERRAVLVATSGDVDLLREVDDCVVKLLLKPRKMHS